MSNPHESLAELFRRENLPPPAVVFWPMTGAAEEDRRFREDAFRRTLAAAPPEGLAWISDHAGAKYNPEKVLPGARSVLVSWLPCYRDDPEDSMDGFGRVARYARGRDYHRELGNRLKRIARELSVRRPEHSFRSFTDIGPLDETWLVQASGLGFKGRHTLAILPGAGSWVFLGHIVTTLELPASPGRPSPMACPEGCTRCIEACPTGALSLPGILDAEACISYQTIEHHGPGNPDYSAATGDRLFGCDACQEICPFNARVQPTDVPAFRKDIAGPSVALEEVLKLKNHEEMTARFAGSPLMRAGRAGLVRNASTAAGNSGDPRFRPLLEDLLEDRDEGVREHARRALTRLQKLTE